MTTEQYIVEIREELGRLGKGSVTVVARHDIPELWLAISDEGSPTVYGYAVSVLSSLRVKGEIEGSVSRYLAIRPSIETSVNLDRFTELAATIFDDNTGREAAHVHAINLNSGRVYTWSLASSCTPIEDGHGLYDAIHKAFSAAYAATMGARAS